MLDILEFQVEGNTVLSAAAIERAVRPFLGPRRRVRDIQAARAALEKLYQDVGYLSVSVDVPVQRVDATGIVRLQVVEGKVDRLKVTGSRFTLPSDVRSTATEVREGAVPFFPRLQDQLAALSATPDRTVAPLLRPGRAPGTLEVELAVDDKLPLHGSVALNSKRSPQTKEGRVELFGRYDNLFQKRHSFGLGYIVSPQRRSDTEVLLANYGLPVAKDGATATLSLTQSNSNLPTTAAGGGAVIGRGSIVGLRYGQPLPRREGIFHFLSAGFDWKNFKETQQLLGQEFEGPIRYLPFSLGYSAIFGAATPWRLNANFVFASAAILRRDLAEPCDAIQIDPVNFRLVTDQFECKRAGASGSFAHLRLDGERSFELGGGWRLLAGAETQLATRPLISNEQYTIGGIGSVRGYLESEASGDRGWRVRVQGATPNLSAARWKQVDLRVVAFADAGGVELVDTLPGEKRNTALAGAGLGSDFSWTQRWRASVGYAVALKDGAVTKAGRGRLFASLNAEF